MSEGRVKASGPGGRERGTPRAGIAFTDLDGTLLAHDDYDWRPAIPALEALRRRGIPLVLASSKTRREIERWRERIGNRDPFIVENGGALVVPDAWPLEPPAEAPRAQGTWTQVFGTPYPRLREALGEIARETGLALRGFGDMAPDEVARRTAITGDDLEAALERAWDEPFVIEEPGGAEGEAALAGAVARRGLTLARGGRFFHLMGGNDKGRAARALLERCAAGGAKLRSMAAGDSANDLELLAVVDRPIVVARPDGTHTPALREALPHARFTRGAGPEGFCEGVLAVLAEWDATPPA